jgi:hypothetical protein
MPARFGSMATESSLFFGELRIVAKVVYLIRPGKSARATETSPWPADFRQFTHAPAAIRARLHLREARLRGETRRLQSGQGARGHTSSYRDL